MPAKSHAMGHPIEFRGDNWVYSDDGSNAGVDRPCAKCLRISESGIDPCLGMIDGAKAACCGHGVYDGYVMYGENKP